MGCLEFAHGMFTLHAGTMKTPAHVNSDARLGAAAIVNVALVDDVLRSSEEVKGICDLSP